MALKNQSHNRNPNAHPQNPNSQWQFEASLGVVGLVICLSLSRSLRLHTKVICSKLSWPLIPTKTHTKHKKIPPKSCGFNQPNNQQRDQMVVVVVLLMLLHGFSKISNQIDRGEGNRSLESGPSLMMMMVEYSSPSSSTSSLGLLMMMEYSCCSINLWVPDDWWNLVLLQWICSLGPDDWWNILRMMKHSHFFL